MADIGEFKFTIEQIRREFSKRDYAKKLKATRDPELMDCLDNEQYVLVNDLGERYPHITFKSTVVFSKHIEELGVRKTNKFHRASEQYPKHLITLHDRLSVTYWFNPHRLEDYIMNYYDEHMKIAEGLANEFG